MNTERRNYAEKRKALDEVASLAPTGARKLRLPDQSAGVGFQTPSEQRLYTAIEKRYGKPDFTPDKQTSFSRGIPGCEKCE